MKTKICSKCELEKQLEYFSKSKRGLLGLRSNCKDCDKIRCRKWKKDNPNNIKATNDKRNNERRSNPSKAMLDRAKRRSVKQGINFDLEESDLQIPLICPVLNKEMLVSDSKVPNRYSPSLDKIKPELGYVKGNIQVISYKANTMKSDASGEELQAFAIWVLSTLELSQETINKLKELNDLYKS